MNTESGRGRRMSRRRRKSLGLVFWAEAILATFTAFLAVLTLVWRDWIEGVSGFDPDHHNGSFEWELVVVCGLLTLTFGVLAQREWRRAPAKPASAT
jgi:hypothetical protein